MMEIKKTRLAVALTALVFALVGFSGTKDAAAQEYDLYAGLIKSKGYVVGSLLAESGLHRFSGDTTWAHVGWNHPGIRAVSILPEQPDVVFLAGGNGALRSKDGAKTWKIVTGWQVTELQDVKINPNNPREILIAGAYGIWKSADGGDSWTETTTEVAKKFTSKLVYDPSVTGRVLAGMDGGVFESMGGDSWKRVSDDVSILDLEQSATDPSIWIAGTRGSGVMLSNDNGKSWSYARGRHIAGKNFYAATVDPHNSKHMAAAGWQTGVMISTNGGRRWKKKTRGLPTDGFYQVEFDPGVPGRLWAATIEEGVLYSDNDGKSWTYAGMFGTLVFDLEFVRKRGAK